MDNYRRAVKEEVREILARKGHVIKKYKALPVKTTEARVQLSLALQQIQVQLAVIRRISTRAGSYHNEPKAGGVSCD